MGFIFSSIRLLSEKILVLKKITRTILENCLDNFGKSSGQFYEILRSIFFNRLYDCFS